MFLRPGCSEPDAHFLEANALVRSTTTSNDRQVTWSKATPIVAVFSTACAHSLRFFVSDGHYMAGLWRDVAPPIHQLR